MSMVVAMFFYKMHTPIMSLIMKQPNSPLILEPCLQTRYKVVILYKTKEWCVEKKYHTYGWLYYSVGSGCGCEYWYHNCTFNQLYSTSALPSTCPVSQPIIYRLKYELIFPGHWNSTWLWKWCIDLLDSTRES